MILFTLKAIVYITFSCSQLTNEISEPRKFQDSLYKVLDRGAKLGLLPAEAVLVPLPARPATGRADGQTQLPHLKLEACWHSAGGFASFRVLQEFTRVSNILKSVNFTSKSRFLAFSHFG